MRNKGKTTPFSHAEFDALPYSVQRKYFSSLERLRIAEQHALHEQSQHRTQHQHQHLHEQPPATCRRRSSRTPPIALHRSLPLASARRRLLLRRAGTLRQDHDVSQADAQFFLSLPEKVRKLQFSREEQVLLSLSRDHRPVRAESQHHQHHQHQHQRFDDFQFDFLDDAGSSLAPSRSHQPLLLSSSSSVSPGTHSRASSPRPEQETDAEAESSLIYLDAMSPPTSYRALPPPPSFRRTLSLTSMSVRHSTSSAPAISEPPLFPLGPQPWHQRTRSQSQLGRRSSHTPIAPVFDPEATHYQDPAARKKLRMFLASPQKFDEAVEFGFPSTPGDDSITPRYQLPPITTDARNFSKDMQTFLRDDRVSFLEEDEDAKSESNAESTTDEESPITPSSVGLSFRSHTRQASSNFSSLDSAGLPPMHPMAGRLNREMTLRMTLTRPDLRADEDHLYGWQTQKGVRDDPFALEELHLSDDMTGAKGAFAVKPKQHGNLVTRLFKRASKRGQR